MSVCASVGVAACIVVGVKATTSGVRTTNLPTYSLCFLLFGQNTRSKRESSDTVPNALETVRFDPVLFSPYTTGCDLIPSPLVAFATFSASWTASAPAETRIGPNYSNLPRISPSSKVPRDSKASTKDAPLLRFLSFSSTKSRKKMSMRSCRYSFPQFLPVPSRAHCSSRNNSTLAIACCTRFVTIRSRSRQS